MPPAPAARFRFGVYVGAALLGLGPLLAGAVALARGDAAARAAVDLIEARDVALPPKISAGPRLPKGCVLRLQAGVPGRWTVLVERGPLGERVVRTVRCLRAGRPAWMLKGAGPQPDIGWPSLGVARRELDLVTTAYDPGPGDNTKAWAGGTRTGARARYGVVAVDPGVIPLGTRVYVEGYGPALAADVGGAIKGRRMDLCFNSSSEAWAWGRKKRRVWIVDPAPSTDRPALREALSAGGYDAPAAYVIRVCPFIEAKRPMSKKNRENPERDKPAGGPAAPAARWADYFWANVFFFIFLAVLAWAVRSSCEMPGDDQSDAAKIVKSILDQTFFFITALFGGGFLLVTLFDAAYEFFSNKAQEEPPVETAPRA